MPLALRCQSAAPALLKVHWQLKRLRYRHGCDDAHACGRHREACPKPCAKHQHRKGCAPGCRKKRHVCPRVRPCSPDCIQHASSCPKRLGGWTFLRPKGKGKREVVIPPPLVPQLREQRAAQVAERLAAGMAPSIHALADGVVEQLDRAGIDRAHIVGNSLGGWIALELARRGRARSVVLFGPAGAWRSAARMTAVATGLRLSFVLLARQAGRAEAIARRRRARRLLLATQVEHPDRVDPAEFAASIRAMKDSPVVAPLLRVITKHPLEYLPADPDCPIRVVWAERDRIIPFERNGLPLLERVPGAELVRLAGVGHVPMSDDPEQVARLILEVTGAVDRAHEKDRRGAPIAPHARPSEAS